MCDQFDGTKGSNPFDSANSKRNFLIFSLSRQNPFGLLPFERRNEGATKIGIKNDWLKGIVGRGEGEESTFEGRFLFFPMIHNILPL